MPRDRKRAFENEVLTAAQDQAAVARADLRPNGQPAEAEPQADPERVAEPQPASTPDATPRVSRLLERKRAMGTRTVECFGVQVAVPPGEEDAMITFSTRIPRRIRHAMAYRCQQLNMTLQDFVLESISALLEDCRQLDQSG